MCFELPSKIISVKDGKANVDCNGHQHRVSLDLMKDVRVGDYVMIQSDYIISKMEKKDVEEMMNLLKNADKNNL